MKWPYENYGIVDDDKFQKFFNSVKNELRGIHQNYLADAIMDFLFYDATGEYNNADVGLLDLSLWQDEYEAEHGKGSSGMMPIS